MGLLKTWRERLGAEALCCVLVAVSAGCVFKGTRQIFMPSPARQDVWQPQPVRMRVYPSSRFAVQPERQLVVLEARIELLDEMGDPIKGVGQYHFKLLGESGRGRTTRDRRLYTWDVPMFTLPAQQSRYDKITGTYLFRLKMHEASSPPRDTTLQVWFVPSGGHRLEAEAIMPGQVRTE